MVIYEIIGAVVVLGLIILGIKWATDNVSLKKDDK